MNIRILEYILAIAEEGSVSKAAERFYLAQPALSAHLRKLEQDLGAPLFYRNRRRMELTRAGVVFANNARLILHLEKQLGAELELLKKQGQQVIRLLVEPSFRNHIVRHVLPGFRERNPEIRVEIEVSSASQSIRSLQTGFADLTLCTLGDPKVPGAAGDVVSSGSLVMGFPPGYTGPIRGKDIPRIVEAGWMPLLHPVGTSLRMLEEEILIRAGVNSPVVLETNSLHNAAAYVAGTQCFAFFPEEFGYMRELGLVTSPPLVPCHTVLLYRQEESSEVICDLRRRIREGLRDFGKRTAL